jgi:hypothetical protein
LLDFLLGIISSLAYHEIGKDQKKKHESLDPDIEKTVDPCHHEMMANYTSLGVSPEEALEREENSRCLINKLESAFAEDDDAQLVLLAIYDGIMKPQAIAEETGIPIDRVYKVRARIRKILS